MYNLQLTPEQIEFRDAVRDFVNREVKPAAIDPKRLEPFEKPLMTGFLDQLAQMGLRGLALPEEAGGAGADLLTSCWKKSPQGMSIWPWCWARRPCWRARCMMR